ncbi:MAG: trigger factor [Clostridiales bacterium]|nr:trigger factor [Clostridiales bacterium]
MLVSANKTEVNTYSVEIKITPEQFKEAVNKAYLSQRKSISVPGFRKGKAPLHIIRSLYGKEVFFEDALDSILPAEIDAAYAQAGINAVDQPKDLKVDPCSLEEGATVTFNVTVKPEITLKQYKGIEAEKEECSVTDEELDAEIQRMRERGSRLIDVDDRPVADGDVTVIDFEGFVDGVPFEGGKGEKYNLTIGSGSFIPGFEEQIIGHSIGEEFDVNVTFPEDYEESLASKQAVFKIKLHEIKFKEYPELDDDFAKDLGEYDTLEELKAGTKEELLERKVNAANRKFEDDVIEKLAENVEGEIPECMFDTRADYNVKDFSNRVAQQGIPFETYLAYMGTDPDSFKAQMRVRAVSDVKIDLALEKIIEAENFEITDEQVEAEYAEMSSTYNWEVEKIKASVSVDTVKEELKRKAAIDFVVSNAVAVAPAVQEDKQEEQAE